MNTQICTNQTNLNTRLLSIAGIFVALENVASVVASYWYSAVFYFGYFSQMPNRH
ncbi:hypothetical protein QNI23_003530 [Bermanella sp. WJH001]|uniref:hypothetical protein n=1 Tax=Bermanella sp. WJH001 TaxID=3048005 RepID=UPI0024BEA126|nr:hypothetical protein [Bermanella sp. WJH001]MDJ1539551.1 hypothetical protein [Bermanella sp. WJH001]